MAEKRYLLLTKEQTLIGKAVLERTYSDGIMVLNVTEGNLDRIESQQALDLIGDEVEEEPVQCKITRRKGRRLELARIAKLDINLRTAFRVEASFDTYIYPVSGKWQGRGRARAIDIACGGVGFTSNVDLAVGEKAEIVIANTRYPLIVRMEILRKKPGKDMAYQYGAKFVNLCPGEERELCQIVFNVQVEERRSRSAAN